MKIGLLLVTLLALAGCSKNVSALDACKKLEADGIASGCKESAPGGLGAAAVERAEFSLPSVPDKGGQVLKFENEGAYTRTVGAFEEAAVLAGPHRYGSKSRLIFVQMNEGASLEVGRKAKGVVDAL